MALFVEPLESLEGLEVGRLDVEGVDPRVESLALALELVAVGPPEALVGVDALGRLLDDVDEALEDVDELVPALGALVEQGELAQREGIFPTQTEHVVPQIDSVGLTIEGVGGELRHALVAAGLLVVGVGDVHHALVVVVEVLEAVLAQVQGLEALERHAAVRSVVEHPGVGGDRLLDVAEVALEGLGETQLELDEQVRVHLHADATLEDLSELLVHRGLGVDAVEGRERRDVLAVELEDRAVVVDRATVVLELLVEHASAA